MTAPGIDLYWIPVGAGTPRLQQASLRAWEAFEAFRAHRRRVELLHTALKLSRCDGARFTLELTPAFIGSPEPPLMTGPVGFRGADRFRLFRYQLRCLPGDQIPDEQWAVMSPVHLTGESSVAERLLALAPTVPAHTWGRRVRGTREMWTSDSTISWLLVKSGIDVQKLQPPPGGRAPGWKAGIALAMASH